MRILRWLPRILFSTLLLLSCRREEEPLTLSFPTTPVLKVESDWAVARDVIRLRERPAAGAESFTYIPHGEVVEIISRSAEREAVEGAGSYYWYQISFQGLRGWVFAPTLDFYETRDQAENAARQMQE